MDQLAPCGCDDSIRLRAELRHEKMLGAFTSAMAQKIARAGERFRRQLYRRRLEVIELRLRWALTLSRNTVWSTIPEIRAAQEARRERIRERYCAVKALRSFAR